MGGKQREKEREKGYRYFLNLNEFVSFTMMFLWTSSPMTSCLPPDQQQKWKETLLQLFEEAAQRTPLDG